MIDSLAADEEKNTGSYVLSQENGREEVVSRRSVKLTKRLPATSISLKQGDLIGCFGIEGMTSKLVTFGFTVIGKP